MEFKEKLKAELSKERYNHSIGVGDAARALAERFGYDEKKAYLAGLLHDCAKYKDIQKQLEKAKEYKVFLTELECELLPVVHAPIGAAVAEYEYGIEDSEILDSIRYHTVGRKGMTKLDKIIYLADMIEINRDFPGVDNLREMAKVNLDEAILLAIEQSMSFNMKKKTIIHPNTIDAWNDIILEKGKGKS